MSTAVVHAVTNDRAGECIGTWEKAASNPPLHSSYSNPFSRLFHQTCTLQENTRLPAEPLLGPAAFRGRHEPSPCARLRSPSAATAVGNSCIYSPPKSFEAVIYLQKSAHKVRKSASQAVLSRMKLTFHATRRTPTHGASRLVQAMPAWSVKTRRAPTRHCGDARV